MAVYSATDVANMAITLLGGRRISNITEDGKTPETMNFLFPLRRDVLLQTYPWRFAMKRTTLPADATAPEWGYTKRYLLPSDCLQFRVLGDESADVETIGVQYRGSSTGHAGDAVCEVVGSYIHTDISAPLKVEYIRNVPNAGDFPDAFAHALAADMAMMAVEELTQSARKAQRIDRIAKDAIKDARQNDAIQRPPERRAPSRWMVARVAA